jgi:iron complex outermembrane receptor protein
VGGEPGTLRKNQLDEAGTTAVFAEDRFSVSERLSAVAGLRWSSSLRRVVDDFPGDGDQSDSRRFDAVTPRFGALYEMPSLAGQVYMNLSRTYEPPLLLEVNSLAVPGFIDLRAQDAWQLEAGIRGSAHGWVWDAAAYDITVRNEILNSNVQPFPGAPFTVPTYRNAERTRHRGIEAGIEREIATGILSGRNGGDRLTARAAYAWNHFRYVEDTEYAGNVIPGAPTHVFDGELSYRHPNGFGFRPSVQWAGGDYYVNSANTVRNNGWLTVSARAEYLLTRFDARIFVEGRNLTDRLYSGAVNVDDAAGRFFLPADRRSFNAGLQWQH